MKSIVVLLVAENSSSSSSSGGGGAGLMATDGRPYPLYRTAALARMQGAAGAAPAIAAAAVGATARGALVASRLEDGRSS